MFGAKSAQNEALRSTALHRRSKRALRFRQPGVKDNIGSSIWKMLPQRFSLRWMGKTSAMQRCASSIRNPWLTHCKAALSCALPEDVVCSLQEERKEGKMCASVINWFALGRKRLFPRRTCKFVGGFPAGGKQVGVGRRDAGAYKADSHCGFI